MENLEMEKRKLAKSGFFRERHTGRGATEASSFAHLSIIGQPHELKIIEKINMSWARTSQSLQIMKIRVT